jgi:putative addiction module component (TIGR02574 family)
MSSSAETLLRQALQLSPNDRAALVEGLITSLDKPDAELDALWLKEAEDRMAAYRSGDLDAIDANQVFVELGKHSRRPDSSSQRAVNFAMLAATTTLNELV